MFQEIGKITATEMARNAQIDPRLFLQVLRDENFDWHRANAPWRVKIGSAEHQEMQRVLKLILRTETLTY